MITVCLRCQLAIRVIETGPQTDMLIGEQSDFWPMRYPCPQCGRNTKCEQDNDVSAERRKGLRLIDLTPKEAFIAYSGVGLPTERVFGAEELETKLKETPIKAVVGNPVDQSSSRYVIDHLELWDGTKVYFGASPLGAVIYRVAPPPEYAKNL